MAMVFMWTRYALVLQANHTLLCLLTRLSLLSLGLTGKAQPLVGAAAN